MIFSGEAQAAFSAAYPDRPAKLSHGLADHPLFGLDRLARLAEALPEDRLEYNRGALSVSQDPGAVPVTGLSAKATVLSIEENGSWMVMKNVERDPDYAALMEAALGELDAVIGPATGARHACEAFVFLSSPGSVTPFHMDPEHNILCQIRGTKTMRVYDREAGLVPPEKHEAFHAGGHRNLAYEDRFDDHSEAFGLAAGDAVHVPCKAPHWVQNGEGVSASFSITWRSEVSAAEGDLHRMNAWLRGKGVSPKPPGQGADGVKRFAYRGLRRAGLV